ncbi:MAG: aminotransferase class V-fold PLP-dependent enzyme [Cyclobacteriaceae bacterium]
MKRRELIKGLGMGAASLPFLSMKVSANPSMSEWKDSFTTDKVKDEAFWKKFKKEYYDVSREFINLENGFFGVQPIPVYKAYLKNIERLNQFSSKYLRTEYGSDLKAIMKQLAEFSGVSDEELLITRNATEAMNIIINGLDLKAGDEVILHKQDYYSMIEAFEMLEKQKGIKIKVIRVPLLPKNDEEIISKYEAAVTPRTKCILLTHMIHLTGQIMPVRKIADTFKPRGIDVIVDAAHSFAQVEYNLDDLNCDFVGVNLHKWFGNPLGAGLLYVKKDRIKDLKPMFGDSAKDDSDIKKLGHFGTLSVPIVMTIPESKKFNDMVTIPLKEKRLRYLQNYWTKEAAGISKVNITTPSDPTRSCAIASFAIEGMKTEDVISGLLEKHNIFTVIRHLEDQDVVRVTPNLYNNTGEMDALLEGLKDLASS